MWPTIVAESLGPVAVPLATALVPGAAAPPRAVAAALARSLAPPEADVAAAPHWLWPSQQTACRRVIAAIDTYGGALLADPVGTGKTYVALATAARFNAGRRTTCLVPASLRDQWAEASRRTGVPIVTWTHQQVSRGRLPPHSGRLVVIDESHRFRNPQTRTYGYVAPWLLGHRVLLLSATPVVNRLEDLAHQLALAVRDDALAPRGAASIAELLSKGTSHPALGLLVLVTPHRQISRPRADVRTERPGTSADALERWLTTIDRLTLSPFPAVAALLRTVFLRAAGSSGAALLAALRRYRRLLLHARDAHAVGRRPGRGALIQLTEGLSDQLLLWDLLPEAAERLDLALTDLAELTSLIADVDRALDQDDPKLARLRSLLADGRSTLVFSISRETVRWLRDRLGSAAAWCTGDRAGIGRNQATRRTVLKWFAADAVERRSSPEGRLAPRHLIATDVAAEGLDLQGAERVVHYDLPWTPMRLEQRRGRVVRAGSAHRRVQVVRFEPCSAIEQRLRQAELLLRKARLPALVGLAGEREGPWRWRAAIAQRYGGTAVRGVAAIAAGPPGFLAGFTIHPWRKTGGPALAAEVLWWDTASGWVDGPALLERQLDLAAEAPALAIDALRCRQVLEQLGRVVRERLRTMRSAAWQSPLPGAAARTVLSRLHALACAAARTRDPRRLALLQPAQAFAAGGHTAGEQRALHRLASMADEELLQALSGLPAPTVMSSVLEARVTGVILFLGETTFPPCRRFARSSSTSMEH